MAFTFKLKNRQIDADGWISAEETWTYLSASSFTVNADVTTKYWVEQKIKLTQTTVKYFMITAVSAYTGGVTTITVNNEGAPLDVLASATITENYYSNSHSPKGFPLNTGIGRNYLKPFAILNIVATSSATNYRSTLGVDTAAGITVAGTYATITKAGYYFVAARQLLAPANAGIYFRIDKNDNAIAYGYVGNTYFMDYGASVIVYMAVGDNLSIYYQSGVISTSWGAPHSALSIMYISS